MLESAPDVIGRFVNAAANRDFDAIGLCFTEDASVEDEERTHRGRGEISAWQRETRSKYDYTVTFADGEPVGESGYAWPRILRATFLEAKPTSNIGFPFATD